MAYNTVCKFCVLYFFQSENNQIYMYMYSIISQHADKQTNIDQSYLRVWSRGWGRVSGGSSFLDWAGLCSGGFIDQCCSGWSRGSLRCHRLHRRRRSGVWFLCHRCIVASNRWRWSYCVRILWENVINL